jgi:hypothetical protein
MKRTQFGWVFLIVILMIALIVIFQNQDINTQIFSYLFLSVIFLNFFKLTIVVTDEQVCFSLGIGLIKGKYNLRDIKYCRTLSYISLGWGIRLRPGVILFNVSGNKAIELELKNKSRKVWIGTNSPWEISEFINLKKQRIQNN